MTRDEALGTLPRHYTDKDGNQYIAKCTVEHLVNKIYNEFETDIPEPTDRILEIPIGEDDLNMFQDMLADEGDTVDWVFPTNDGEDIDIVFMSECEYGRRRKWNETSS